MLPNYDGAESRRRQRKQTKSSRRGASRFSRAFEINQIKPPRRQLTSTVPDASCKADAFDKWWTFVVIVERFARSASPSWWTGRADPQTMIGFAFSSIDNTVNEKFTFFLDFWFFLPQFLNQNSWIPS